jgi:shikimate kinase
MTAPRYVLIGPPGSGKTTVGRALATLLGVGRRDTDTDIERIAGKRVTDIFVDDGEPAFRELERAAVAAAMAEHDGVLSLGGGAVMDPATQALLRAYVVDQGIVVFLDVSAAAVAPRVGFNAARPLLVGNPRKQWSELMEARRPIYEELATITISTEQLEAQRIAREIVAASS